MGYRDLKLRNSIGKGIEDNDSAEITASLDQYLRPVLPDIKPLRPNSPEHFDNEVKDR